MAERNVFDPLAGTPLVFLAALAISGPTLGGKKKLCGCIYVRYSTRFQRSIKDQILACREWAEKNDVTVLDQHIFIDEGESGKKSRRPGHLAMLKALDAGEIDVCITFSTNRLYRKMHRAIRFVEETIVEKHRRCVFVAQNIDTANEKMWKQLLYIFAMLDEVGVQMSAAHIRQAHIGLTLAGKVAGTLAFGYVGVEVAGSPTRMNKVRRETAIDPTLAPVVVDIFRWFISERLGYKQIARRLKDNNVAPPPKAGRWTSKAVKYLLRNRRYTGDWSYGWTEAQWQSSADYSRQHQKAEPAHEHQDERLRILDDLTFLKAQERIAEKRGFGGRPSHLKGPRMPDLLTEVLWCPIHHRYVSIRGGGSMHVACPACKSAEPGSPSLYSVVNRQRARRQLCQVLADRITADPDRVERIIQASQKQVELLQRPDDGQLESLRSQLQKLTNRSQFILDNPGDSQADRDENAKALATIRAERATLDRQLAQAEAARNAVVNVPTNDEVESILKRWGEVLLRAAESTDPAEWGDAMAVVRSLTGGKVVLSQHGPAKAKCGSLRGTFRLRLLDAMHDQRSPADDRDAGEEIVIDFKETTEAELIADEVKSLYDQELLIKEIARTLTVKLGRPISRNVTTLALAHWYESRGLPVPDGRSRRATLEKKHLIAPRYQQIAREVGRLAGAGMLLQQIAKRLGCDRNTITQSLTYWRKKQGEPNIDGRSRRKLLQLPTETSLPRFIESERQVNQPPEPSAA